jgi:hypothetical protein
MFKPRADWAILILAAATMAIWGPGLQAAELKTATLKAWDEYVRLTEERIGNELESEEGFFGHDFIRPNESRAIWRSVLSGRVMVTRMETQDQRGRSFKVPGGMIHHWRGTVLIPAVRLEQVIHRLRYPDTRIPPQKDVLETRVLERGEDSLRIYLKLIRKKIITVAYNTEHLVHYQWHGVNRASSRSVATRIAELEQLRTPQEREKVPGKDRGFLWRLNSYWRYQQVAGGVVVECESLTLSRGYPFLLKPIVAPIVRSVARKSMKRTLASLRSRLLMSPANHATLHWPRPRWSFRHQRPNTHENVDPATFSLASTR